MRLAVISDVHGNRTALAAVLEEIESAAVDRVACLGDIVGYGPNPSACTASVRQVADFVVQGNHDRTVHTPGRYASHPTAGPGLRHAATELDEEALEWLDSLPEQRTVDEGSVLLVHSHPEYRGRYVSPYAFETVAQDVDAEVLLLGHTHVQSAETAAGTLVVNPGSVGQPRDGDADAAYAIVDTETWTADLRRVEYPIAPVRDAVESVGLPDEAWQRLTEGR